ncbi:hypothetical protein ACH5RR_006740 [Cinchona calisaya]|uniref:Uncharacterized protein n=1 Tax=Cinchona calisaya TaxID=153742 RepID=A0ABD3APT1_9GENT
MVRVGNGGVVWEVSVHKSHLVAVPLVNSGDKVLDVARGILIAVVVVGKLNEASILIFFFLVASSVISWKSRLRCLNLRVSFPQDPSISICLAFSLIFTPLGCPPSPIANRLHFAHRQDVHRQSALFPSKFHVLSRVV